MRHFPLSLALVLGSALWTFANVAMTVPFGNHMVLQRGKPVPIWGTATAGESIKVSFNGQSKSTTTGSNGKWKVTFDAMTAGGPFTLTATGNNTVSFSDVMVGEVWHCAGQSNMDTRMNYYEYPNLADSIATANYPKLRYLTMRQPGQTIQWQQVSPSTVGSMTATGYFFGRALLASLDGVAVGILNTSVGGTIIEQWLDPESIASIPALASDANAGSMYNEWILPTLGYAVQGTVWLQGENNASSSALTPTYGERLAKLIPGWRKAWGQSDMPFIIAGLCHKGGKQTAANDNSNQAKIREFQRIAAGTIAGTHLSVLVDLGDDATWHYPQKPEAGLRLGRVALGAVYGKTGFSYLSPQPKAVFTRNDKIVVVFANHGSALQWRDKTAPHGFEVAGANNVWSWASNAELNGDTVFLSTNVTTPTQVRHAWANQPILKLWTKDGLPVSPFRENIGTTPPPPEPPEPTVIITKQFEMEENCSLLGITESTNTGFSGSGYVNFDNAIGSNVGLVLQVVTSPDSATWIRYANGGTTNRPMTIAINGVTAKDTVAFAPTGSWTTWKLERIPLTWSVGRDSIVLSATTGDGGPNIDWIGFENGTVNLAPCSLPVTLERPATHFRITTNPRRMYNLLGARMGDK